MSRSESYLAVARAVAKRTTGVIPNGHGLAWWGGGSRLTAGPGRRWQGTNRLPAGPTMALVRRHSAVSRALARAC